MLTIDGSLGEGGGQIVRTSLALSLCLGKSFQIKNIRVKRKKPGLAWQHLAAVKAAAKVGNADVQGAELKSTAFTFVPQGIHGGEISYDIGTAGSTSLVLQTLLPALLLSQEKSVITLSGGTHNPLSPSFDFINKAFFPVLRKMGANIDVKLLKPGFAPKGGGLIKTQINPGEFPQPLNLNNRGKILQINTVARVAGLPQHIAEREINTIRDLLNFNKTNLQTEELPIEFGPGNVVIIEVKSENITEIFTAYGQPHLPAEKVARNVALETNEYLHADVPVDTHLADQLLIPMALSKNSSMVTSSPSLHTLTNIDVIKQFMPVEFKLQKLTAQKYKIATE